MKVSTLTINEWEYNLMEHMQFKELPRMTIILHPTNQPIKKNKKILIREYNGVFGLNHYMTNSSSPGMEPLGKTIDTS